MTFFYPNIEVVIIILFSWMVYAECVFVPGIYPFGRQYYDLLSPCDLMYTCTDWTFDLLSDPKEK